MPINLGNVYRKLQMMDKAVDCYLKAIQIDPNEQVAIFKLGFTYAKQFKIEKAEKMFLNYIQLSNEQSEAYRNLGLIYSYQGRHTEAIKVFLKGIEINPEYQNIYDNLANQGYYKLGDYTKMSEALHKSLKIKQTSACFLDLGFSYLLNDNLKAALQAFEKGSKQYQIQQSKTDEKDANTIYVKQTLGLLSYIRQKIQILKQKVNPNKLLLEFVQQNAIELYQPMINLFSIINAIDYDKRQTSTFEAEKRLTIWLINKKVKKFQVKLNQIKDREKQHQNTAFRIQNMKKLFSQKQSQMNFKIRRFQESLQTKENQISSLKLSTKNVQDLLCQKVYAFCEKEKIPHQELKKGKQDSQQLLNAMLNQLKAQNQSLLDKKIKQIKDNYDEKLKMNRQQKIIKSLPQQQTQQIRNLQQYEDRINSKRRENIPNQNPEAITKIKLETQKSLLYYVQEITAKLEKKKIAVRQLNQKLQKSNSDLICLQRKLLQANQLKKLSNSNMSITILENQAQILTSQNSNNTELNLNLN